MAVSDPALFAPPTARILLIGSRLQILTILGGPIQMPLPDMPPDAVVRISRGRFDPARFADVASMRGEVGAYLAPAIARLEGLLGYYAGTSAEGSIVDVSLWDSDEHANQMGQLKEMVQDARAAALALAVTFDPIVNYPLSWHL